VIDHVEVLVKGGAGGNGAVSFRREKFVPKGGPDGGDGGSGGSVIVVADPSVSTLLEVGRRHEWRAEAGQHGQGSDRHGRRGESVVIRVPCGTQVRRKQAGGDEKLVADLSGAGESVVVARGGLGGWGNARFATSSNQAPRVAQRGGRGEETVLVLDLKLLSDVAIIGMPNAGKSTLLSLISAAHPRIAAYPFTTLEPVLGVVEMGYRTFVVAEIPGLIEGAHSGAGLGQEFLRHAERARIFIHLLDGSRPDPLRDLDIINGELRDFQSELVAKPQVVAVNKLDQLEVQKREAELAQALAKRGIAALFISAATGTGVGPLLEQVAAELDRLTPQPPEMTEAPVIAPRPLRQRFEVAVVNGVCTVRGQRVEAFAEMMPLEQEEGSQEFWRRLARWGVVNAIKRAGAKPGERVRIGHVEVEWPG
jgi:GTP-binding protein